MRLKPPIAQIAYIFKGVKFWFVLLECDMDKIYMLSFFDWCSQAADMIKKNCLLAKTFKVLCVHNAV